MKFVNYRSPRWMRFIILFDNRINVQFIYVLPKGRLIYFQITVRRYMMDFRRSKTRRWWDRHFLQMMVTRLQGWFPNSETGIEEYFHPRMKIRLLGRNINSDTGIVSLEELDKKCIIYSYIISYGIELRAYG